MIRIGVSACLLGDRVRYDGEHKRDDFLVASLGAHVEFVTVCPEVELGLGTRRVAALEGLSGYVLKKDSPSCGVARVRVLREAGVTRDGVGFFARALRQRFPHLPIAEEGGLGDLSFVARVFAYARLSALRTRAELVAFHEAHALTLRAQAFEALRGLVGEPARYTADFMAALDGEVPRALIRHHVPEALLRQSRV